MSYAPEPLLVFPQAFGPALRNFAIPLLWSGRLITHLPGFVTSCPTNHFKHAAQLSASSELAPLMSVVVQDAWRAASETPSELATFEPLGEHVFRAIAIAPGGRDPYATLDELPPSCLSAANRLLAQPEIRIVACIEFIWRFYEHCLEMGATPQEPLQDPTPVIHFFEDHARRIGSCDLLLAECLLHRLQVINCEKHSASPPSLLTDTADCIELLSAIGSGLSPLSDCSQSGAKDVIRSQIGFSLFSAALSPFWKSIDAPFSRRLANVLENRHEELLRARNYCLNEAADIVGHGVRENKLQESVKASLAEIEEEVQAITELDRTSLRNIYCRLTEDATLWMSVVTMLGSAAGSFPAVVPAAAAVTFLSRLGTTALRESRARRDILCESAWSMVYYLK